MERGVKIGTRINNLYTSDPAHRPSRDFATVFLFYFFSGRRCLFVRSPRWGRRHSSFFPSMRSGSPWRGSKPMPVGPVAVSRGLLESDGSSGRRRRRCGRRRVRRRAEVSNRRRRPLFFFFTLHPSGCPVALDRARGGTDDADGGTTCARYKYHIHTTCPTILIRKKRYSRENASLHACMLPAGRTRLGGRIHGSCRGCCAAVDPHPDNVSKIKSLKNNKTFIKNVSRKHTF